MIGSRDLVVELAHALLSTRPSPYQRFTARRVVVNASCPHAQRCLGVSSDAMTRWAFNSDPDAPMPSGFNAPADAGDLAACQRTLDLARLHRINPRAIERMETFVARGVPAHDRPVIA